MADNIGDFSNAGQRQGYIDLHFQLMGDRCAYILLIFPKLQEWSQVGTFLIFSGITLAGMLILVKLVPETKDKTLEQIEAH